MIDVLKVVWEGCVDEEGMRAVSSGMTAMIDMLWQKACANEKAT